MSYLYCFKEGEEMCFDMGLLGEKLEMLRKLRYYSCRHNKQMTYSTSLINIVERLCEVSSEQRTDIRAVRELLLPHRKSIMEFTEFLLEEQPPNGTNQTIVGNMASTNPPKLSYSTITLNPPRKGSVPAVPFAHSLTSRENSPVGQLRNIGQSSSSSSTNKNQSLFNVLPFKVHENEDERSRRRRVSVEDAGKKGVTPTNNMEHFWDSDEEMIKKKLDTQCHNLAKPKFVITDQRNRQENFIRPSP
jgi:hypothetical protein